MKLTKQQLRKIIKEELFQEMGSFDMGEDVLELLATKHNVMEEDAPVILRALADRLEGVGKRDEY